MGNCLILKKAQTKYVSTEIDKTKELYRIDVNANRLNNSWTATFNCFAVWADNGYLDSARHNSVNMTRAVPEWTSVNDTFSLSCQNNQYAGGHIIFYGYKLIPLN